MSIVTCVDNINDVHIDGVSMDCLYYVVNDSIVHSVIPFHVILVTTLPPPSFDKILQHTVLLLFIIIITFIILSFIHYSFILDFILFSFLSLHITTYYYSHHIIISSHPKIIISPSSGMIMLGNGPCHTTNIALRLPD